MSEYSREFGRSGLLGNVSDNDISRRGVSHSDVDLQLVPACLVRRILRK